MIEHIIDNLNVRISPIRDDCLKINDEQKPKYIRLVTLRELHNSLADSNIPGMVRENGKLNMCYKTFRLLLQRDFPELKPSTLRYMQMCGCEYCIVATNLQEALNKCQN